MLILFSLATPSLGQAGSGGKPPRKILNSEMALEGTFEPFLYIS